MLTPPRPGPAWFPAPNAPCGPGRAGLLQQVGLAGPGRTTCQHPRATGAHRGADAGSWLTAPPVLLGLPGPPLPFHLQRRLCLGRGHLLASSGVPPELCGAGGPGQCLRPGFHLLGVLSRRRHPTHPAQGPPRGCPPPRPGSPRALSLCSFFHPDLRDRHWRGAGPGPPNSASIPEPGQGWGGTFGTSQAPLGAGALHWVHIWPSGRAFGLPSPPPPPASPRPFLSPLAGCSAKPRAGAHSARPPQPFPASAEGGDAPWG